MLQPLHRLILLTSLGLATVRAATIGETFAAHDTLLLNPRELTFYFFIVAMLSALANYGFAWIQERGDQAAVSGSYRGSTTLDGHTVAKMMLEAVAAIVVRVGAAMAIAFAVAQGVSIAEISWKIVITLTYTAFVATFFLMLAVVGLLVHVAGVFAMARIMSLHERLAMDRGLGRRGTPASKRRREWPIALRLRRELVNAAAAAFPQYAMDITSGAQPGLVPHEARIADLNSARDALATIEKEKREAVAAREAREEEIRQLRRKQWDEDANDQIDLGGAGDGELEFSWLNLIPAVKRYRLAAIKVRAEMSANAQERLLPKKEEEALEAESAAYAKQLAAFEEEAKQAALILKETQLLHDVTLGDYLSRVFMMPQEAENLSFRPAAWGLLVVYSVFIVLRWTVSLNTSDTIQHPVRDVTLLVTIFGIAPSTIQAGVIVLAYKAMVEYLAVLDNDRRMLRQIKQGSSSSSQKPKPKNGQVKGKDDDDAADTASVDSGSTATADEEDDDAIDLRKTLTDPHALNSRRTPSQFFLFQGARHAHRLAQACYLCNLLYAAVLAVEYGYQPTNQDTGIAEILALGTLPILAGLLLMPVTTITFTLFNRTGANVLHHAVYDTIVVPCELRTKWKEAHPTLAVSVSVPSSPATTRSSAAASSSRATSIGGPASVSDHISTKESVVTSSAGWRSAHARSVTNTTDGGSLREPATASASSPSAAALSTKAPSVAAASSPDRADEPPTNPLNNTSGGGGDISNSTGQKKRVGFYFGDPRDEDLHAFVPGSGVNLPGARGHYAAPGVGSSAVDAFHGYAALEGQRAVMEELETRVRSLVKLLKGERKYGAELTRRADIVKSVLVGRKLLDGSRVSRDVTEEDLMWTVRPVEEALKHLQDTVLSSQQFGPLPRNAVDRRKELERRKLKQLLPLFTPEAATDFSGAGSTLLMPSLIAPESRAELSALSEQLYTRPPPGATAANATAALPSRFENDGVSAVEGSRAVVASAGGRGSTNSRHGRSSSVRFRDSVDYVQPANSADVEL